MFVIVVSYIKPLSEVDKHLQAHRSWLAAQYEAGVFLASGRQVPPAGGVILAHGRDRQEIEALVRQDPFAVNQVAHHQVIEFKPNLTAAEFAMLKEG